MPFGTIIPNIVNLIFILIPYLLRAYCRLCTTSKFFSFAEVFSASGVLLFGTTIPIYFISSQGGILLFSKKEMSMFRDKYFKIIREEGKYVEVMSVNTGHCWIVFKKTYEGGKPITLYHKHTMKTEYYHLHWETYTVESAIKSIKGHDKYILSHGETIRWMRNKGAAKYGAI